MSTWKKLELLFKLYLKLKNTISNKMLLRVLLWKREILHFDYLITIYLIRTSEIKRHIYQIIIFMLDQNLFLLISSLYLLVNIRYNIHINNELIRNKKSIDRPNSQLRIDSTYCLVITLFVII